MRFSSDVGVPMVTVAIFVGDVAAARAGGDGRGAFGGGETRAPGAAHRDEPGEPRVFQRCDDGVRGGDTEVAGGVRVVPDRLRG